MHASETIPLPVRILPGLVECGIINWGPRIGICGQQFHFLTRWDTFAGLAVRVHETLDLYRPRRCPCPKYPESRYSVSGGSSYTVPCAVPFRFGRAEDAVRYGKWKMYWGEGFSGGYIIFEGRLLFFYEVRRTLVGGKNFVERFPNVESWKSMYIVTMHGS